MKTRDDGREETFRSSSLLEGFERLCGRSGTSCLRLKLLQDDQVLEREPAIERTEQIFSTSDQWGRPGWRQLPEVDAPTGQIPKVRVRPLMDDSQVWKSFFELSPVPFENHV